MPEEHRIPQGCSGRGGYEVPEGSTFTNASRIAIINDSNTQVTGPVGNLCSRLSTTLLLSASTLASTQDVLSTGLRDAAFLAPKPDRLSVTEVVLSTVAAAQGVAVTFVLLFVQADEWGPRIMRLRHWPHRRWFQLLRQPVPPHVIAADPRAGGRTTRLCGLLLVTAGLTVMFDASMRSPHVHGCSLCRLDRLLGGVPAARSGPHS